MLKAAIGCAGPVIRAAGGVVTRFVGGIVSVLAGGIGLVVAGLEGAVRTALQHDRATIQIDRSVVASLANSPFVDQWYVHGGSLSIRADGTATQSFRWGLCTEGPADCYYEHLMTVRLAPDGKTAIATVRSARFLMYENGTPQEFTDPPPGLVAAADPPGTMHRFRFTAPGLIKDIDRDENEGNPYFCSSTRPPADHRACGA